MWKSKLSILANTDQRHQIIDHLLVVKQSASFSPESLILSDEFWSSCILLAEASSFEGASVFSSFAAASGFSLTLRSSGSGVVVGPSAPSTAADTSLSSSFLGLLEWELVHWELLTRELCSEQNVCNGQDKTHTNTNVIFNYWKKKNDSFLIVVQR